MFDSIASLFTSAPDQSAASHHTKRVMTMVKNERMGGYVPKWEVVKNEAPQSAKAAVEQTLAQAEQNAETSAFDQALAYHQDGGSASATPPDEDFTFGDLIDMANPLHHIPLVGTLYRELTGDQIKPVGQIVGGALFGGPIGAVAGLVNGTVRHETGKDVGEAMFDIAFSRKTQPQSAPALAVAQQEQKTAENVRPVQNPAQNPVQSPAQNDVMDSAVIAFADLKPSAETPQQKSTEINAQYNHEDYPFLPRGPINDLFTNTGRQSAFYRGHEEKR